MVDVQPFPVSKDLVPHPIDSQPFVSMDGHQVPGMYCIFFWNIKQHVYCVETRPQEQHVYIYIYRCDWICQGTAGCTTTNVPLWEIPI